VQAQLLPCNQKAMSHERMLRAEKSRLEERDSNCLDAAKAEILDAQEDRPLLAKGKAWGSELLDELDGAVRTVLARIRQARKEMEGGDRRSSARQCRAIRGSRKSAPRAKATCRRWEIGATAPGQPSKGPISDRSRGSSS